MALKVLFSLLVLALSSAQAATVSYTIEVSDPELPPGGVTLFRLDGGPTGQALSATLSVGQGFMVEDETGTWGIAAIDLGTKPGEYRLSLNKGENYMRTTVVRVIKGDYAEEHLTLPLGMVELDKKTLARVMKEAAVIKGLWAGSNQEPLWSGPFIMPVKGRVSTGFGTRRTMNNIPKSPHSGMDIVAFKGTPVKAANRGRILFVGDFYFYGKFTVIDHGLGVFTVYSHLDEVDVETGQTVEKGAIIGNVGATGRVTGAHLHFGVKVGAARVSPTLLFKLIERLQPVEASKPATSSGG